MTGARADIMRQRARLQATFERIAAIHEDAAEARADFAKYLCVRVSGYLETSVIALLTDFVECRSSPQVGAYVRADIKRFQNANRGKLLDVLGRFDDGWRTDLTDYLVDERSDALGAVVTHRHRIAHGEDSDLTYVRIERYWQVIKQVVDYIADLIDPQGGT